jgi:tetratricopeptide (TPR) repeat protein
MENRCLLLPRISLLLFVFLPACAPHSPSSDLISQYLSAKDAYAAGDLEGTEQRLGAILAKDRGFHQARFLLGKVYYFQNRTADARRVFTSLIRGHRGYNEAEIWLVRVLMQEGATDQAKKRAEDLIAFDAADPRLLFLRGSLALEEADLKNALEFFERAAQFGDELARTHLEMARLYYQFDLPERAMEELALCRTIASEGSLVGEAAGTLLDSVRKERGER